MLILLLEQAFQYDERKTEDIDGRRSKKNIKHFG